MTDAERKLLLILAEKEKTRLEASFGPGVRTAYWDVVFLIDQVKGATETE